MADQDALRLLAEAERHNDEEATDIGHATTMVGFDRMLWAFCLTTFSFF